MLILQFKPTLSYQEKSGTFVGGTV